MLGKSSYLSNFYSHHPGQNRNRKYPASCSSAYLVCGTGDRFRVNSWNKLNKKKNKTLLRLCLAAECNFCSTVCLIDSDKFNNVNYNYSTYQAIIWIEQFINAWNKKHLLKRENNFLTDRKICAVDCLAETIRTRTKERQTRRAKTTGDVRK